MGEPSKVRQSRASKERNLAQQNPSRHLIESRVRTNTYGETVRVQVSPSELATDVRNCMPTGLLQAKYQLSSRASEASVTYEISA